MEIGDYIPNFVLPATTGENFAPVGTIGKWIALLFVPPGGGEPAQSAASPFRALHSTFLELGVNVVGMSTDSPAAQKAFAEANGLAFPLISDVDGNVSRQFGVSATPAAILISPAFRVAQIYAGPRWMELADELLADAKARIQSEPPRLIQVHAPVLLIPDVLPAEMRKTLIGLWETENQDSGFMTQVDGKTVGKYDYGHKIRRDHFMTPGAVQTQLQKYISGRVTPEIRKAFNYNVSRREDFRIACYDASRGGYFRPHRDNTTDATAHRRFAMSLLLNDDYEGGYLRFPEFGKHTYRPPAGAAVIFSCSLVHEATDVTAGRRFVLLSFFYGEAEAKAREEYNRRTGGVYKA